MLLIFWIIALVSVCSAVAVVALKNPIYNALALILNLLMVAATFALLDAHFLAVAQIIVYAGAIMVLVLFMIMLLNVKVEVRNKREQIWMWVAIGIGAMFLVVIVPLVNQTFTIFPQAARAIPGTVESVGLKLYGDYVFLFEIASVLIMTAVAGAVMLAKKRTSAGTGS